MDDIVKITNAVYRLLDHLPDSDPLKNKAKEKALAILERATDKDIETLQNYLELARSQGWLDAMNVMIINKEYGVLRDSIAISKTPIIQKVPKIENYSGRQKAILELLLGQEKVQVADIIKKIPNVTKRTVRRDLDDLLKKGVVVRMGEFNHIFYQRVGT
jgi:DNA-binding transcriptional ArsR family regulator